MRQTSKVWLGASLLLSSGLQQVKADNPFVQTIYTADPAPLVYNGRVYVFTSHDEDTATDWYDMRDWRVFSSEDMVNWQHYPTPMSLDTFSWASIDAWAGQVVPRNGKFYYYVPVNDGPTWDTFAIGVGVSDNIEGPYTDAIGGPLVANGQIDPTVFIDDDGQAYMYWGNPDLFYVKLNEDMVSYEGEIQQVNLTTEGFGNGRSGGTAYNEGPWLYKRDDLYYMVYSAICCQQNIQYSTAPSPTGPWTYGGVVMATEGGSDTNHVGLLHYLGEDYFFYHNDGLPGGHSYRRSSCVEKFTYNPDGSFPLIPMTLEGPEQIGSFDPYVRQEAETFAFSEGVETEDAADGGLCVSHINNGDYIKVKGIDFLDGAKSFEARVASGAAGGEIELRINGLDGEIIGTCQVENTGDWQSWTTVSCPISGSEGKHDLFFAYVGEGDGYLFNIDWWQFA